MSTHTDLDALVPDYVLGSLSERDRRRMDAALARSGPLQKQVDEIREALGAVAAEVVPPVAPRPELRARLLGDLHGADRFRPFFAELSRALDLPIAALRTLLAKIDEGAGWLSMKPGIAMFGFEPGPAAVGRQANFLRLAPGARFPRHQHVADEFALVLEGAGHDDDGRSYGPGAVITHPAGSTHEFHAGDRRDLLLVVLHDGVDFT